MIGMSAAFGVAVAYGLVELFIQARSVVIIIGLAMFIAAGFIFYRTGRGTRSHPVPASQNWSGVSDLPDERDLPLPLGGRIGGYLLGRGVRGGQ